MKTENVAMHNQLNCWSSSAKSPLLSAPMTAYSQSVLNGHNQMNQLQQLNERQLPQQLNQPNKFNQINQQMQINQHNSPRDSFSSDQSVNGSPEYSFNSSSNSTNSNISNNLVTSTMNNLQLIDQIRMPARCNQSATNTQQQFSTIKTSIQVSQSSIKNSILPRCFNDIPTPGLEKNRVTKKKNKQSAYKHVPHREKPAHVVAKRNCRERKRVQQLNEAFGNLRNNIPIENKNKRVSKFKTLQKAIDYIRDLKKMLNDFDSSSPNAGLGLRGNFSLADLANLDEPSSTSEIDFKLEDEDTNSESIFENDFLDETSQKSTEMQNMTESTNQYVSNYPVISASHQLELLQSADTNNNLINSNAINSQIINQNSIVNASFDQNMANYSNSSQIPTQNVVNKENILYQNVTVKCNAVYNNVSYVNYTT